MRREYSLHRRSGILVLFAGTYLALASVAHLDGFGMDNRKLSAFARGYGGLVQSPGDRRGGDRVILANFERDVIKAIGHDLNIDPARDMNRDHVAAWVNFVNLEAEEIWPMWKWAELERTEERPFRTIWNSERLLFRAAPANEVFYIPTMSYYRVLATAPNDPPPGTLPTNTNFYEPIEITDRYLDLQLPGQREIGIVLGLYAGNPRLNGCARHGLNFRLSEKGVDVAGSGGATVFVKYQIAPSRFGNEIWAADKLYLAGDRIVWSLDQGGDGQCYRALINNIEQLPGDRTYWALVPMPRIFARYLVHKAAAMAAEDAQTASYFESKAEDALTRAVDKQVLQGRPFPRYRIGWRARGGLGCWFTTPDWTNTEGATPEVTTLTDAYLDLEGEAIAAATAVQDEGGLSPIPQDQDYVDIVFGTAKVDPAGNPTTSWQFTQLYVESSNPNPPDQISPSFVSNKTAAGGRVWTNAGPSDASYSLRWRIKAA